MLTNMTTTAFVRRFNILRDSAEHILQYFDMYTAFDTLLIEPVESLSVHSGQDALLLALHIWKAAYTPTDLHWLLLFTRHCASFRTRHLVTNNRVKRGFVKLTKMLNGYISFDEFSRATADFENEPICRGASRAVRCATRSMWNAVCVAREQRFSDRVFDVALDAGSAIYEEAIVSYQSAKAAQEARDRVMGSLRTAILSVQHNVFYTNKVGVTNENDN